MYSMILIQQQKVKGEHFNVIMKGDSERRSTVKSLTNIASIKAYVSELIKEHGMDVNYTIGVTTRGTLQVTIIKD